MTVIIVGAGAAGLMAAYELTRKGVEVTLLESENRIGGRIQTLTPPGFVHQIEAGAEFIHGDLPLTMRLMKKANLPYVKAGGKMYRYADGKIQGRFGHGKSWNDFYEKLAATRRDMTLEDFLEKHFSGQQYNALRAEAREMAQGLDLAEPSRLSVLGIKKEWLSEETQYRTTGGYGRLVAFLCDTAIANGLQLHLNSHVAEIRWRRGAVEVKTHDKCFVADKVLLTIPLPHYQRNAISFFPDIAGTAAEFSQVGFGEVIKFAIEFSDAFWEKAHPDLGFLFTDGGFTYWTQLSLHKPFLCGWIGDKYAGNFRNIPDRRLLEMAVAKLRLAFGEDVRAKYRSGAVFRFTTDSASRGGYSWLMPGSKKAIAKINDGVENTIWFAGEALHPGGEPGTVEAALQSGKTISRKILKNKN